MRRVVVTGLGATSAYGFGAEKLWNALVNCKNGIKKIEDLDLQGELVSIASPLPRVQTYPRELNGIIPQDDSIPSFFMAVKEALDQSGLNLKDEKTNLRTGLCISDRAIGLSDFIDRFSPIFYQQFKTQDLSESDVFKKMEEKGCREWFIGNDLDSVSNIVARAYKLRGPQLSVATACASGNNSIGEAMLRIQRGKIDSAIAGGAYNYSLSSMIGFTRLGALTMNPDPDIACSPFDSRRSGFVMGSGCGIFILEELEHAKNRGANILGEVVGYGSFADAFRATDPDPEAKGAVRTIKKAMEMAKINPSDLDYINAHGTSTKMNDWTETKAIKTVLGKSAYDIPVSSTKSMIGHSIMAAGALEGIVCIKSLQNGVIHPTRNWTIRDEELDLDYVPNNAREVKINYVLSNNFGFGGQNASVIFKKFN